MTHGKDHTTFRQLQCRIWPLASKLAIADVHSVMGAWHARAHRRMHSALPMRSNSHQCMHSVGTLPKHVMSLCNAGCTEVLCMQLLPHEWCLCEEWQVILLVSWHVCACLSL